MSESQVALMVSAAMSANAIKSLPAMLRYQGRRVAARVSSPAVLRSETGVGSNISAAFVRILPNTRRAMPLWSRPNERSERGREAVVTDGAANAGSPLVRARQLKRAFRSSLCP